MVSPKIPTQVLILDSDQIPALTIARSLARRGCRVHIAGAFHQPVSAYSNSVSRCFTYPDPLESETAFIDWLVNHLTSATYGLVIPVTERTLVPLSRQRSRLSGATIAMASEFSLSQVLNKTATFKLAEKIGVATPTSIYINTYEDAVKASENMRYPVVIKPSQSVAGSGLPTTPAGSSPTGPTKPATQFSKRNVEYAIDKNSLIRKCETCLRYSPVILQSYFEGVGAGIELIAREGEILYPFQHIRLHEVPLTGGGSSLRMSADLAPELLDAAQKLIAATRWTGVAMVEFKWNPSTGEYRLMEINGRFWGSLPLAAAAGADFPAMLLDLMLTGDIGDYPDYRRGVYCRKLPSDLQWLELVLRTRSNEYTRVPGPKQVLRDFALALSPKHHFDTQSLRDPKPGFIEIYRVARSYSNRLGSIFSESWLTVRQRLFWRNGTVREKLRAADTVLFLCYGNINRSALADWLMRGRVLDSRNNPTDLRIYSAGFHPETGRLADSTMVTIAAKHGVDLSASRSRCVDPELVSKSDAIFVMEKSHYQRLQLIDDSATERTFLLGAGDNGSLFSNADIPDPYNRDEAVYATCFSRIENAVGLLASYLRD